MNRSQLASLYDAHAPALFRFLMALTGDEHDTRDILQELFYRLAKRPADEVLRDPAAWLYRAARNLLTDQARRRGVRDRAIAHLTLQADELPASHGAGVAGGGTARLAAAALAELPEEQRAVVHLKIWEDMTFGRIAEVLDIPPNTAASRYRYAMVRLRAVFPNPCTVYEP